MDFFSLFYCLVAIGNILHSRPQAVKILSPSVVNFVRFFKNEFVCRLVVNVFGEKSNCESFCDYLLSIT